MYSNIISDSAATLSIKALHKYFSPTELTFSPQHMGKSAGYKKYLKITSITPDGGGEKKIIADSREIPIEIYLSGFNNSDSVVYGDYIYVDDANNKVMLCKCINKVNLRDYASSVVLNKIHENHITFQIRINMNNINKKPGISNVYSDVMKTHLISSTSISDTGLVGSESSSLLFIKVSANDENYFYNGERITDIDIFRQWLSENDFYIYYEMESCEFTDISNTPTGIKLLSLQPESEYCWTITGAMSELCVYTDIDYQLAKIKSMIIEE